MPEQSVDKSGKQRISLFVGDAAAWKTPPAALAGVVGAKELGELRALASSVQRLNCRYRRCQEAMTLSVALFVVGIGIASAGPLPGSGLVGGGMPSSSSSVTASSALGINSDA